MKRTAKAHWNGDLKTGHGELTTQSRVLNETPYSFNARFASGNGSNPEELLAAAHAGCFTMAISYALSQAGFTSGQLNTTAAVSLDPAIGAITLIKLELIASAIEGLPEAAFLRHADLAKQNCVISKALSGVPIELSVQYQNL